MRDGSQGGREGGPFSSSAVELRSAGGRSGIPAAAGDQLDAERTMEGGAEAVPAVAFVGWSGSGKTTLLERLLPVLEARGLRAGYFKGSCGFQIDREGKDSDRLFRAGAERVLIASPGEGALRFRLQARDVHRLIAEHFAGCDLVLVEGCKNSELPKIEVYRGEPVLHHGDRTLVAVVSDASDPRSVPRFGREEIDSLARFLMQTALGME